MLSCWRLSLQCPFTRVASRHPHPAHHASHGSVPTVPTTSPRPLCTQWFHARRARRAHRAHCALHASLGGGRSTWLEHRTSTTDVALALWDAVLISNGQTLKGQLEYRVGKLVFVRAHNTQSGHVHQKESRCLGYLLQVATSEAQPKRVALFFTSDNALTEREEEVDLESNAAAATAILRQATVALGALLCCEAGKSSGGTLNGGTRIPRPHPTASLLGLETVRDLVGTMVRGSVVFGEGSGDAVTLPILRTAVEVVGDAVKKLGLYFGTNYSGAISGKLNPAISPAALL